MTMPLSKLFAICGLSLAVINLSTKFEVTISTYYKDMKGGIKPHWNFAEIFGIRKIQSLSYRMALFA